MSATTREIRLASRPDGEPTEDDFEIAETAIPEPGPGEVLVRNSYLSVDPYMRGRMRDVKSYLPPYEVGKVMDGGAVGQVVASNDGPFEEGAWIQHQAGWREHSVVKVPVIAVVGRNEAAEGKVALRRLGSQAQEILTVEEAIRVLTDEATPPDLKRANQAMPS